MNENSRRGIGSLAVTVGTKLLGWKGILLIVGILILIPLFFLPVIIFFAPASEQAQQLGQAQGEIKGVPYADIINVAAATYNLDPALLAALIKQESQFKVTAVSDKGALGLTQLMPGTAREMGVKDPFDPYQNIMGGAKYLRRMLDMFDQDIEIALAAYNAGPGNVKKAGNKIPNKRETKVYVPTVIKNYKAYQQKTTYFAMVEDKGGRLGPPIANMRITSRFGMRKHPILRVYKRHEGVDFGAPVGTPIYAAESGVVIAAGPARGYGNWIVIDHGNRISTLYAHMYSNGIYVKRGQKVRRGQKIGAVGSAGFSTGPHLHFEVRKNGTPVDPMPYIQYY